MVAATTMSGGRKARAAVYRAGGGRRSGGEQNRQRWPRWAPIAATLLPPRQVGTAVEAATGCGRPAPARRKRGGERARGSGSRGRGVDVVSRGGGACGGRQTGAATRPREDPVTGKNEILWEKSVRRNLLKL